jgi:diguanylate cyclase (GGDEF)-like protein
VPMEIESKILRSRLARRVFTLFVLAAIVPVAVTAYLSLDYITKVAAEGTERELHTASKQFGNWIYERLITADNLAAKLAAVVTSGDKPSKQDLLTYVQSFEAAAILHSDGRVEDVFGSLSLAPDATGLIEARATSEKSAVVVRPDAANQAQILIARDIRSGELAGSRLIARVKRSYIFSADDALPYLVDYCVFSASGTNLHCTRRLSEKFTQALGSALIGSPSGAFKWLEGDVPFFGYYREMFLASRFQEHAWTVVLVQPYDEAFEHTVEFRSLFWPVLLAIVVTVILLSLTQIRRTLVPLEKLMDTTRRLSHGDFTAQAPIDSPDEFGVLAKSINGMSEKLERQISVLRTLSQIDQLILSSIGIERVIDTVLARTIGIVTCDAVAIILVDQDSPELARCYFRKMEANTHSEVVRVQLSAADLARLYRSAEERLVNTQALNDTSFRFLEILQTPYLVVTQITRGTRVLGSLCLGFEKRPELDARDKDHLNELTYRLAVALSSVEREEQLYHQAHHDALTDLPNMQLLKDRLHQEVMHAKRQSQQVALLYIDLDRFKHVNDTLGHAIGDLLLKQAARRLQKSVRETDTVARIGGDEFVIILANINSPHYAGTVGSKIIEQMSRPFQVEGHACYVGASIGISIFPDDTPSPDDLLKNADTAMYSAKEGGRGQFAFFTSEMNDEAQERSGLERDLRVALENRSLSLAYQPQIDLRTGAMVGLEALVRWEHPERGPLPAQIFVGIAEERGLIEELGSQVLAGALEQFAAWRKARLPIERISVNVSSRQLISARFVERLDALLHHIGVEAESLELEITESLLLEDTDSTLRTLGMIHDRGIRLAIDDFGTGYSSLSYLRRLPFDVVKIDRSFVADLPDNRDAASIADTIIAMASALGKSTVAEGIETQKQMHYLRERGCHVGQGFLFSKPLSAIELVEFRRNWDMGGRLAGTEVQNSQRSAGGGG